MIEVGSYDLAPARQREYILPRSMVGKGAALGEMQARLLGIGRRAREENDRLLAAWRSEWQDVTGEAEVSGCG